MLRAEICAKAGFTPAVHSLFVRLAAAIETDLRLHLSSTTLERLWKYSTRSYDTVYEHTLDILCQWLGDDSWQAFVRRQRAGKGISASGNIKLGNAYPLDDAASVNWEGNWRMPTDAEWTELRTKCTWTWTTQNGVNGRLVTGPNGNSIFLPAAGIRSGKQLLYTSSGNYWSSSLASFPDLAWAVDFYSSGVYRNDYYYRYYGQSIRPVTSQ